MDLQTNNREDADNLTDKTVQFMSRFFVFYSVTLFSVAYSNTFIQFLELMSLYTHPGSKKIRIYSLTVVYIKAVPKLNLWTQFVRTHQSCKYLAKFYLPSLDAVEVEYGEFYIHVFILHMVHNNHGYRNETVKRNREERFL